MAGLTKKIKDLLKRFIPAPVRTLKREIERVLSAIRKLGRRMSAMESSLKKEHCKLSAAQNQLLRESTLKLKKVSEDISHLSASVAKLSEDNAALQQMLRNQANELAALKKQTQQQERHIMQKFDQERIASTNTRRSLLSPQDYERELALWYRGRVGEILNLQNPRTFNEKIQWMKLYDCTPLKTRLADKYLVRDWIREKIGDEFLIPLLGVWDNFDQIDFDLLPDQFVLKATHGCGWNLIVRDKSTFDKAAARAKFNQWMRTNYAFVSTFELQYMNIPPKIIAEKYMEELDQVYDYKLMCFGGEVKFLWVDTDRFSGHKRAMYTTDWQRMDDMIGSFIPLDHDVPKPKTLDKMLEVATILSQGFAHVRVDLYEVGGKLYFGEMTFTSGNGFSKFSSREFALKVGDMLQLPPKSPIPELKL